MLRIGIDPCEEFAVASAFRNLGFKRFKFNAGKVERNRWSMPLPPKRVLTQFSGKGRAALYPECAAAKHKLPNRTRGLRGGRCVRSGVELLTLIISLRFVAALKLESMLSARNQQNFTGDPSGIF